LGRSEGNTYPTISSIPHYLMNKKITFHHNHVLRKTPSGPNPVHNPGRPPLPI